MEKGIEIRIAWKCSEADCAVREDCPPTLMIVPIGYTRAKPLSIKPPHLRCNHPPAVLAVGTRIIR